MCSLEPTTNAKIHTQITTQAYDYFSDQHQIFYRDKLRKSVMWYDPVFKVTTLAGQEVWRRRHYRVRRAAAPGQFRFTVLDNGVLSDEYWRILDCADDLSWAVFYYGGAASAAGTSYTGALVVTKSGKWPVDMIKGSETARRIEQALSKGGIRFVSVFVTIVFSTQTHTNTLSLPQFTHTHTLSLSLTHTHIVCGRYLRFPTRSREAAAAAAAAMRRL